MPVIASMLDKDSKESPLSTSSCRDDDVVRSCCSILELDLLFTLDVRDDS